MNRTPPRQTRPQSLRYFCPTDEATTALEESKTGTWFRFNCACVKLFTHLTKKSSQGKFSLLAHCHNLLFPKQFFFLWPLVHVFGEERQVTWMDCLRRPKMYIYLNTANEHLLVTTTGVFFAWACATAEQAMRMEAHHRVCPHQNGASQSYHSDYFARWSWRMCSWFNKMCSLQKKPLTWS